MKRLKIGDTPQSDGGGGPGPSPTGSGDGSAETDVDYSNFNSVLGGMHWEREARNRGRKGSEHEGDDDIDEDL